MVNEQIYGVDYSSTGETSAIGDILVVEGIENAKQAIRNQLLTPIGSYPSVDTEYGSEVHEIIGESITDTELQQLQVYIRNALKKQERVQELQSIVPTLTDKGTITCQIAVLLVNGSEEEIEIELE